MNQDLPDVQARFRKGKGTSDQIANICWIIEKARGLQNKTSFIDYAKTFDCVDNNELWEISKEMRVPDHLTCFLKNLYVGFSRGRSGGLGFPSLSEFSTVIVIYTVKGFGIVNKAEIDVFWNSLAFSMIQHMLAI